MILIFFNLFLNFLFFPLAFLIKLFPKVLKIKKTTAWAKRMSKRILAIILHQRDVTSFIHHHHILFFFMICFNYVIKSNKMKRQIKFCKHTCCVSLWIKQHLFSKNSCCSCSSLQLSIVQFFEWVKLFYMLNNFEQFQVMIIKYDVVNRNGKLFINMN